MAKAAEAHDEPPRRLSFTGAWQTMTAFPDALRPATAGVRDLLMKVMLRAIASHRVGDRFGRVEPHAKKGLDHRLGHCHGNQAADWFRFERGTAGRAGTSSRSRTYSNRSWGLAPKKRSAAGVPSGLRIR